MNARDRPIQPNSDGWNLLYAVQLMLKVTENKFAHVFSTEQKLIKMSLTFCILSGPCCIGG